MYLPGQALASSTSEASDEQGGARLHRHDLRQQVNSFTIKGVSHVMFKLLDQLDLTAGGELYSQWTTS